MLCTKSNYISGFEVVASPFVNCIGDYFVNNLMNYVAIVPQSTVGTTFVDIIGKHVAHVK